MNRLKLKSMIVLGALIVMTGCGHSKKNQEAAQAPAAPVDPKVAEQERIRTELEAGRSAYVTQTESRLGEFDQRVADLKAKAPTLSKPNQKKMENAASDLQLMVEDVRKELAEVKSAAPENWVDEKRDVDSTLSRVESQYSNTLQILE